MEKVEKVEQNKYDIITLNNIRDVIEKMNKFNQIEVLRIFSKYNEVVLNENKNGIHINLTEVPEYIIDDLVKHLDFVLIQENHLKKDESMKDKYKNIYFGKDNKDYTT